jgi:hypothetical protein
MRDKRFTHGHVALAAALALALVPTATVSAQSNRINGGVSSQAGFDFHWETRLDPATPPLAEGFGMTVLETAPNIVHRVMLDRSQKVYFGYDARVDVLPNNAFRVTFGPLTRTAELERVLGDAGAWRALADPMFPPPQTIRGGDVLELPLLTNSGWGQRLTDYVTVREPAARSFDVERRDFVFPAGTPRDFTVDDAEMRLSQPLVSSTRRQETGGSYRRAQLANEIAGPVLWLYVPYRGRYVLSLRPHASLGFQKAGEVRGTSLRFAADGTTYNIASASRIASGQTAFNLYVLFQAGWRPTYPNANVDIFQVGSADRVEYLVGTR